MQCTVLKSDKLTNSTCIVASVTAAQIDTNNNDHSWKTLTAQLLEY